MKRITVLELASTTTLGGIERAMQEFALTLDQKRFRVLVAAYDTSGARTAILEKNGFTVHKVTNESLKSFIEREKVDVVHSHTIHVKEYIGSAINVQEVVFSGGYAPKADCNLIISKALACKINRITPITYGKDFYVLYYPQNVASWDQYKLSAKQRQKLRSTLQIQTNDFVIGRVGRSEPSKTDFLLLKAAPQIVKQIPNVKFVFVGLPALYRYWLRLQPALRKRCIFLPESSDDVKLAAFYQIIDVFWHTASRGETFGNVNAEAMLFAKPVITHSTPFEGTSYAEKTDNAQIELVDHMRTGLVANYPKDVAAACKYLYDNPKAREAFGRAGRQKVLDHYDARKVVTQFESLITNLVNGKKQTSMEPSKAEVEAFLHQEYAKRVAQSVQASTNLQQLRYRTQKSILYKPLEFGYLSARYILRNKCNRNIEHARVNGLREWPHPSEYI